MVNLPQSYALSACFQHLLYICRFYELKFEIIPRMKHQGTIKFLRADGSELEPINGGYCWDFNNLTDFFTIVKRIIDNRQNFDSREYIYEEWKQDLDNSFFNEI